MEQIFTFSFLGNDPKLRKRRLAAHVQQLRALHSQFPEFDILSLAMQYTEEEKDEISLPGVRNVWTCKRLSMAEARNWALCQHYSQSDLRYLLICDDDAYPWDKEGVTPSSSSVVAEFLRCEHLDRIFAPHVVCCLDVYRNYFFEKTISLLARQHNSVLFDYEGVMLKGSVMLVRSDCGVLFREDVTFMEESFWRMDCAEAGKQVWRCSHLLLKELLRKEEDSTVTELNKGTHSELSKLGKVALAKAFPRHLTLMNGLGDGARIVFRLTKPRPVYTDSDLVVIETEPDMEELV